ncbi:MAG: amidase [Polyangiaceae bacterium]
MGGFKEFGNFDAVGLSELVRRREVTPLELCDEAIARIERLNPQLNAVVTGLFDSARERAKQPFDMQSPVAGVPFLVKDLLSAVAGVPLSSGSRLYRNHVPSYDAELVRRYRRAGLLLVGKTNTPEFGLLPITEPVLFGACRNPWDLKRTPGGSSGGAAAAVAAGIVPVAHGGDGGGSLRIPASCCGLFGLKPSRGRNPVGPDASEHWLGLAVEHVVSRSVRDSAALLDASAGPELTSPYHAPARERPYLEELKRHQGKLRIAVSEKPHLRARVDPDCRRALADAAQLCRDLGHEVEEASVDIDADEFGHAFFTVICGSVAGGIERAASELGRRPARDELEVATWLAGLLGAELSAGQAILALEVLQDVARRALRLHDRFDILLTPTLSKPPLPIGALEPRGAEALAHRTIANLGIGSVLRLKRVIKATVDRVFDFVPFTPLANVTGQPSMSVPLFWNEQGLPIGSMFTARLGEEATLFRLAAQLETARPWAKKRPPLHADSDAISASNRAAPAHTASARPAGAATRAAAPGRTRASWVRWACHRPARRYCGKPRAAPVARASASVLDPNIVADAERRQQRDAISCLDQVDRGGVRAVSRLALP